MASAMVSERAIGCTGAIVLPTVVSVAKLKYVSFDVSLVHIRRHGNEVEGAREELLNQLKGGSPSLTPVVLR